MEVVKRRAASYERREIFSRSQLGLRFPNSAKAHVPKSRREPEKARPAINAL
jgi:hypothetical protein